MGENQWIYLQTLLRIVYSNELLSYSLYRGRGGILASRPHTQAKIEFELLTLYKATLGIPFTIAIMDSTLVALSADNKYGFHDATLSHSSINQKHDGFLKSSCSLNILHPGLDVANSSSFFWRFWKFVLSVGCTSYFTVNPIDPEISRQSVEWVAESSFHYKSGQIMYHSKDVS